MGSITIETFIPCAIDVVFRAALDVDLHQLSMQSSSEHIVGGVEHGVMQICDTVTWRAKHFGVWWTMTSRIVSLTSPNSFVDEQIQGPFRSFRHRHDFHEVEGGTLMTDRLDLQSPVLGFILEPLILDPYLCRLIRRRNHALLTALTADNGRGSSTNHSENRGQNH